eukprot:4884318-Alexandrium_andersonii.AAC.1
MQSITTKAGNTNLMSRAAFNSPPHPRSAMGYSVAQGRFVSGRVAGPWGPAGRSPWTTTWSGWRRCRGRRR